MRYCGRDSYDSRDRRSYGDRSDGRYEPRYRKAGKESVGKGFAGKRTERVTHVGRRDTLERNAESGRTRRDLDQAVALDSVKVRELSESSCHVNSIQINADEKLVVDAAEK